MKTGEILPKVYVTKYALSQGIEVYENRADLCEGGKMISIKDAKFPTHYHGKDWHRTRGAAEQRVLEMFDAKKRSLEKSLKELKGKRDAALKTINEK